jgi:peptidyl-prolyl cis-trans isomerase B (cyclophilin B)
VVVVALALVPVLAACGGSSEAAVASGGTCPATGQSGATAAMAVSIGGTTSGCIVVALDTAHAPKAAGRFISLAKSGFYDGLTFHRVVPDFVIQGGDPNGTFDSQFFIVTGGQGTQLPPQYARFGRVVSGMDVAQKIEALAPATGDGPPTQKVTMDKVTIAGA